MDETDIGQRCFGQHSSQDVAVECMGNARVAQALREGGSSLEEARDFVHCAGSGGEGGGRVEVKVDDICTTVNA